MIPKLAKPRTTHVYEPKTSFGPNSKTPRFHQIELNRVRSKFLKFASSNRVEVTDMQLLDKQMYSMMEKGQNRVPVNNKNRKQYHVFTNSCKVCGEGGRQIVIKTHIEAKHITGITHTCEICGNRAKTKSSLLAHKSKYHRKVLQ